MYLLANLTTTFAWGLNKTIMEEQSYELGKKAMVSLHFRPSDVPNNILSFLATYIVKIFHKPVSTTSP